MAHSDLLSKKNLENMSAQIDKMNSELADLARVLDGLPPSVVEITSAEADLLKQELYFESYNILNIDYNEATFAVSDKKSTPTLQSNEKFENQYMLRHMPSVKFASFPMKVVGDVFYAGDGVTSVVGDAEIPSGTTVDATLIVKGNFVSGENCRLLRDVKALKDITIGQNTVVEGNLVAGGKITLRPSCVVHGAIKSDGDIEIGENVIVEEILCSKSLIVLGQFTKVLRTVYAARGLSAPRAM